MKIEKISGLTERKLLTFTGTRECTNAVSQLMQNNPYSLTEPNQRNIINSISELGKSGDSKTINFLLNTAAKSKYSTNIVLKNQPKNNWKTLLLAAAAAAAALLPAIMQSKIFEKISAISNNTTLNKTEKDILKLREQLLAAVDLEQIKLETKGTEKDFEKNLDYLIVSSETTLEHKKYILQRLNYFMSDKYEINPQLADKKSIAAAEMVNDMAIAVPGNNIPNIKAVNQKQHGICAAISIVRKKLAYEDKPNYIDAILSELDNTSNMTVYDRNHLGSGKKIKVEKVPVDFNSALAKGYRIIDASTTHWMQIGGMIGATALAFEDYTSFDADNFDVKTDSFFNIKLDDPELEKTQNYYQALIVAKSLLENYKASSIKEKLNNIEEKHHHEQSLKQLGNTLEKIKSLISQLLPNLGIKQVQTLTSNLLRLEKPLSNKIEKGDIYSYIPNEETKVKKEKIANYIINKTGLDNISDKDKDSLYSLVDYYNSLAPKGKKDSRIRHAENLYNIAAAFRYQTVKGLEDETILEKTRRLEGIPPREELLTNHIDDLIKILENNSDDANLVLKQLAPSFENIKPTRKNMIKALKDLNEVVEQVLTTEIDKVYTALQLGSKKEALIEYINESIQELQNGNNSYLKGFSTILETEKSPEAIITTLEKLKTQLAQGDEKDYMEVFRKLRNTSQISYIKMFFEGVESRIPIDESTEEGQKIKTTLDEIRNQINNIDNFIETCTNALTIRNNDGEIIYSSQPKDILLRKFEVENRIASEKALKELQLHFIKITQDLSSDEFQSRQGKLKDKSLYKFSDDEKALLKDTEQSINAMLAIVKREFTTLRSNFKDILEQTNQQIGLNNGRFWVVESGSSGLSSEKQVRILEYMTGRPHRTTPNIKDAIEEIKKSPYSGITGSSVFHDRIGGHAQYIADIAPVEVLNEKGEKEVKEVLFQDNTWGASEDENIWIDSQGIKRTDYSDRRGGNLGYITDGNFRNGNFVDRILGDMILSVEPESVESKVYKKLKHPNNESFQMPQYYDIILDGKSSKIKSVTDSIHDTLFVQTERLVQKLSEFAQTYTTEELQAMITDIQGIGKEWKPTYEALKKRISPLFGKGITTEEEFNNLANNDYLKVILEKIALKKRAPIAGLEASLAKARTIEELASFSNAQKTIALKSFKYAFAKSLTITEYLSNSFSQKEEDKIEEILKKYNIELSDEDFGTITDEFTIKAEDFDGSAKHTINQLMTTINNNIDKVITNPEANKELKAFYKNFLTDKIYFNESDLDMSDFDNKKNQHIIKFIDKIFDPANNKEFVKTYRRIQDLTEEQFENEILPLVSDEDLGIKQISGFDILKAIQRHEEAADTDLMNNVYYDNLVRNGGNKEYEQIYSYDKLSRTAKFVPKNTFSRMYNDINNDLSLLTLTKLFNKYKNRNLLKYNAYPAYPKTDFLSESYLRTSFNNTMDEIEHASEVIRTIKNQIHNYRIADLLIEGKTKLSPNTIIEGEMFANLNNLFGQLVTINMNDISVKDVVEGAETALELEEGKTFAEYIPQIDKIVRQLTDFRNSAPEDKLHQVIEDRKAEINLFKKAYAEVLVQPKYQTRTLEKLNNYIHLLAKGKTNEAGNLKNELYKDFAQQHILNDPQELLNVYIKSCAKDSPLHNFNSILESILTHGLEYAKLLDIQSILMDAISEGVDLSAKTHFKKHKFDFEAASYSMDSENMIAQMVNQLIGEENNQTALLFIEKLGLAEPYIKYIAEQTDYDKLKSLVTEATEITNNFVNFKNALEPYILETQKEMAKESDADITSLDKLKDTISDLSAKFSLNDESKTILLTAIENVKFNCINNPNASKSLVFGTLFPQAQIQIVEIFQGLIKEKDAIITSHAAILNMINQILLPVNSNANQLRETANNKFMEILQYKDSLNSLQEEE